MGLATAEPKDLVRKATGEKQEEEAADTSCPTFEEGLKQAKAHEGEIKKVLAEGTKEEKKEAMSWVEAAKLGGCLPVVRKLAVEDKDISVRCDAIRLLAEWKGSDDEMRGNFDCLRRCLQTDDVFVREVAASRLARSKRDKAAVGVLVEIVACDDSDIREMACLSLMDLTLKNVGPIYAGQTEEERKESARKWQDWWRENRDTFK
jgi:hypothetical protein